MADWRGNLLESDAEVQDLLKDVRTVAVLGIKTEAQAGQPAFYVPEAAIRHLSLIHI